MRRIIDAINQIPQEGAGILVLDRTSSDWIDHEDVEAACYGEEQSRVFAGKWTNGRLPGLFDDASKARVSAVVSYTRRWRDESGTLMTVMHNPNALIPMPRGFLAYDGVRHTHLEADRQGYRLVTTPDADAA